MAKSIEHAVINSNALRYISRWALQKSDQQPVILLYHGVEAKSDLRRLKNSDEKHLPRDAFIAHLKTLKQCRKVVPLSQMMEGLRAGEQLKNCVAITFDDGYENNYLAAAPLLAEFNFPATFFLATGFIGTEKLIWTDQVEFFLEKTKSIRLALPWLTHELPLKTLAEKCGALKTIKSTLKKMKHTDCLAAVDQLGDSLGVLKPANSEEDYRFMSWEQARSLRRAGFEVGAHTVSHPILSRLSFDLATSEILVSRDRVATELGDCSNTFCYPNGKSGDYTNELVQFCSQHFSSALSTNRGYATCNEIFELRRFSPLGGALRANIEWMLLRE